MVPTDPGYKTVLDSTRTYGFYTDPLVQIVSDSTYGSYGSKD